ncbi:hypothetical protein [Streptomyces pseudogriseolus]|uniref:hypothetical protein n=1 Tax=Streptomyces pseudogriseolus TaxID=36817 RepID=UPI003FA2B3B8
MSHPAAPARPTTTHGYTWADVRDTPVAELSLGDVFLMPAPGLHYLVDPDRTVRGGGLWEQPLEAAVYRVTARTDTHITQVDHDGHTHIAAVPTGRAHVLRVTPEAVRRQHHP